MTAWDRELLLEKLAEHGITPDKIDYLVCSHGHSDHVGNLNLFLNSQHFVGSSLSFQDSYFFAHDFDEKPFELDEGVEVIATPGHTSACISLVVKDSNIENGSCVVLAGDLFEKEEDVKYELIWLGAGSDNPEKQKENRLKVAKMADFIVPGHGKMFKVTNEMREKLEKDLGQPIA